MRGLGREAATQLFAVQAILHITARLAAGCTHLHGFVDNSTAEMVMEKGRSQSAGLNAINLRRIELLQERSAFMKASRVASVDNDVADMLSRGALEEARAIMRSSRLFLIELDNEEQIGRSTLDLSHTPTTWA